MDSSGTNKRAKTIPPHEKAMGNLDIVGMILMYIPTLCLLKLKLTCRGWRDLISKDWFTDEHTKKHFKDRTVMALYSIRRPVLNLSKLPNLPTLWFLLGRPTPTGSTRNSLRQLAHKQQKLNLLTASNGLMLCLKDDRLIVFNPTRQTSTDIGIAKHSWRFSHHISFDSSVSKFYKVLIIITVFEGFQGPASFEISIYSSATKQWKDIKIDGLYRPNISIRHVMMNGKVYWLTSDTNRLLILDVAEEVMETGQTICRILHGDVYWSGVVNDNWFVVEGDLEFPEILHIYRMDWAGFARWTHVVYVNMRPMMDAFPGEEEYPYILCLKEKEEQGLPFVIFLYSSRIIGFNTLNNTFNVLREMPIEGDYDPTAPLDIISAPVKVHNFIPTLANVEWSDDV